MARLAVSVSTCVAMWSCAPAPAALAAAAATSAAASTPLLACLEPIARQLHVRIVDRSGVAVSVTCLPLGQPLTIEQAMDRLLKPHHLDWRRLDDGTLEVIAARASSSLILPALNIEGEPVAEPLRPDNPLGTPLAERATAVTSLDQRWLATAPLLGLDQISWYAPNVYGSGQSLAIRGTERDGDYFPALTVTFDGIDLGTRLLDDELVPLDDVTELKLARGPRTFESGEGSQAGAIALKTALPAAEPTTSGALGAGNAAARNGAIAWSGPLGTSGLGATIALDARDLPNFVRQIAVPEANVEKRDNYFGRFKLRYTADSGLSAQMAGLALSGDSSDRRIVAASGSAVPGSFDLFERDSFATDPLVARTHARGAAGFVRYEQADRWSIDVHASVTTIMRDVTELPIDVQWTDHELRRRSGVTVSDHPAQDWTILAGIEHDQMTTAFYTPIASAQTIFNYFATSTDSASAWLEHSWASTWNAGIGVRWSYEQTTVYPTAHRGYDYHLPIPLAVLEWRPWTDHVLSLSYGQGYRSGGQDPQNTYSPERSENLEFSWRAQWLAGALHTAFCAFEGKVHNRYTYHISGQTGDAILAPVRDRGVEFELDADLSDRWQLRAGVGALSSRFSSAIFRDGESTSEAPPQTATVGIRYGLAAGWYGAVDAYRAAAARYYNPSGRLPSYGVLGFRVGYRQADWEAAVLVTNAFDANYIERIQTSAANQTGYRLGDPRRVELRVKRSW